MSTQIIKLSQNAAERIKEIMSKAEDKTIGVRDRCKVWWLCRNVLYYGVC